MHKTFWQFACLTLLLSLLGCGSSLVEVTGQITIDGVPIDQGEIRFLPTGGSNAPSAATIITDGQYHVDVSPGEKRVEILGYKVIGQSDIGTTIDIKKQIIPERYNTRSELTCTIANNGEPYDFHLQP